MAPLGAAKLQALRVAPELKRNPQEHDRALAQILSTLHKQNDKDLAQGDLLDSLDPSLDTLPYLFALYATVSAATSQKGESKTLYPGGPLWSKLATFLVECDRLEIRYGGSMWKELVEVLGNTSLYPPTDGQPVDVLSVMASAIQRMDTSSSTITSNHVNLVRLCVETDSTASAIPVLDKDIHTYTSNPPTSSDSQPPLCTPNLPSNLFIQRYHGVTSAITLELVHDYYIHGAICYMDMDNWSRAAFLLETVLSTPSRDVANYAMLEAYKKWVLVKLLHEGKAPGSPPGVNTATLRPLKALAKPYDVLAEDFEGTNRRKLLAEAHEGAQIWENDGNSSLVRLVLEAHRKRAVDRLGKVFQALPLTLVAQKLEMPDTDTERYLRQLISNGSLQAKFGNSGNPDGPSILEFSDSKSTNSGVEAEESRLHSSLVSQTTRIKELADHIGEIDRRLSLTKEYIDHWRKSRNKWDQHPIPEEETVGDMAWDQGQSEDEDADAMKDVMPG